MKRPLLAAGWILLLMHCARAPQPVQLRDVDERIFVPIFEVERTDPGGVGTVRLPYVAGQKREVCEFRLHVTVPDTLSGRSVFLAVSVDDHAEVYLGDSLISRVYNVQEVYLGDREAGEHLDLRLRCWADAEPTRLRGLTLLYRPPRNRRLRELESAFAAVTGLREESYTDWEWAPGPAPGDNWKPGGPGTSWSGEGTIAWFRTTLRRPDELNGFTTAGDSLWLRLAVDDSGVVYIGEQPVAHFRRGAAVALPASWQSGQPVDLRLKIINFRGPGRFIGAWLVSRRLSELASRAQRLSEQAGFIRLYLEQCPAVGPDEEESFARAAELLRAPSASGPRNPEALASALDRAERALGELLDKVESSPPFLCGPYLQNVAPTAITVMWETAVPCRGKVHYRPVDEAPGPWSTVEESVEASIHEVRLTGLHPDTPYEYWVQANGSRSATYRFRTAPTGRKAFRLAVWGDSRSDPYAHETVISEMIQHRPDLAVNVGDVVGHGANLAEWVEMHFKPIRHLAPTTPTFVAIGNHEYGGYWELGRVPPFEEYVSQPGNEYYFAFTHGGSRFIILDSNREEDGIPLGREQFEWLKRELASDSCQSADWRFVFFHHPPYSEAWDWGGYYDGEELFRQKLVPLFEKHNVTFVFSGHTHDYERGQWPKGSGPYYVITGGGGAELDNLKYKEWPQIDVQAFEYHFCLLDVDSTSIRFRAIRQDGSVMDEFRIER